MKYLILIFCLCLGSCKKEESVSNTTENQISVKKSFKTFKAKLYLTGSSSLRRKTSIPIDKLIYDENPNIDFKDFLWGCENCGSFSVEGAEIIAPIKGPSFSKEFNIWGKKKDKLEIKITIKAFKKSIPTSDESFCQNYLRHWVSFNYECKNPLSSKLFVPDFHNVDLKNTTFENLDFDKADMEDANLKNVKFINVDLREVNFKGAELVKVDFHSSILYNLDFSKSELSEIVFKDVSLKNSNFSGAKLKKVNFMLSDEAMTNPIGKELKHNNFEKSKITQINLTSGKKNRLLMKFNSFSESSIESLQVFPNPIDFKSNNFSKAKIKDSFFDFSDLSANNFSNTEIKDSSFKNTQLIGSTFKDGIIKDTTFENASLVGVNCSGCLLESIDLRSKKPVNKYRSDGFNPEFLGNKNERTLLYNFEFDGSSNGEDLIIKDETELITLCRFPESVLFTAEIWESQEKQKTKITSNRSEICTAWNKENPYIKER
ncbi:MAG: pentapeptide repeat-containing protein [Bdellovibrionota bacterium]|nr:pentapeptide repeat-containing protein [Bdellovibrionota bacterium]